MKYLLLRSQLTSLFLFSGLVLSVPNVQERLLITAPPQPKATSCKNESILKRQENCEFGRCGSSCLAQGAFCCGPAGTLATSPSWVCDNGACITSVRGTAGIVDCYDPDNPGGTTQSCIDNVPTTTCKPTDRCYTCLPAQPFCRWETYIADNSPTLSWFSCIESRLPDVTFLAATITGNSSSPTLQPSSNATASRAPANNNEGNDRSLPMGAIVGIGVGGGLVAVGIVALLAYCCIKRRKTTPKQTQELSGNPVARPLSHQAPTELDGHAYARSELNSATAYSPDSQPTTPFNMTHNYARNAPGSMVRGQNDLTPAEYQVQKMEYFTQTPRELSSETAAGRQRG